MNGAIEVDFSELVGRLKGVDAAPSQRPLIEAQYMELAIRFERLQANVPLAPGMFVRQKPGCGVFKPDLAMAWIVLRPIDPASPIDKAIVDQLISKKPDSLLGWRYHWLCASLTDNGGSLMLWAFDSWQIEPVAQDELPAEVRDVPAPPGAKPRKAFLVPVEPVHAEHAA